MLQVSDISGVIYDLVTLKDVSTWIPNETLYSDVKETMLKKGRIIRESDYYSKFDEAYRLAFRRFVNEGGVAGITTAIAKTHNVKLKQGK